MNKQCPKGEFLDDITQKCVKMDRVLYQAKKEIHDILRDMQFDIGYIHCDSHVYNYFEGAPKEMSWKKEWCFLEEGPF